MADANHYYYTFSTVAQALAAVLAVMAAFVILRAQWADSQVQAFSKIIADLPHFTPWEHAKWLDRLLTGNPQFVQPCIARIREGTAEKKEARHREWAEFAARKISFVASRRASTAWWLNLSLLATALTVVYAIGMLPITPRLCAASYGPATLFLAFGLVLLCVAVYTIAIVKILSRPSMPENWGD